MCGFITSSGTTYYIDSVNKTFVVVNLRTQ